MKKIILLILFVIFLNCYEKNNNNVNKISKKTTLKSKIKLDGNPEIDSLKRMIVVSGTNYTYSKFYKCFESGEIPIREFVIYSMIMADKHNDDSGYINTFEFSIMYFTKNNTFNLKDFEKISEKQKTFAISYLNKGALHKKIGCINALIKIYENGIGYDKNPKKVDSLFNVAKSIDPSFRVIN